MGQEDWVSYGTNEEKQYRFRPILGKRLRFQVKAAHDCHLIFSSVDHDNDDVFEVFIGAWEGTASAIRFKKGDDLTKVDTPDILNAEEYRSFWVTFDDGVVRVGHADDRVHFMEANLPEKIDVAHYGYSTGYGSAGWWQFHAEKLVHTEDCLTYKYEPLQGNHLSFGVACSNDAHIAFTSGPEDTTPMYEIFLGGWENGKSAIRLNKDEDSTVALVDTPDILTPDSEKWFWISIKNGHIRVGEHGNADPFMEYINPEKWTITHYGYCTGWGSCGKWKFE